MSNESVDITGLDKATVLAALYNASFPMGMGILQARSGDLTVEEAREVINERGDDVHAMFGSVGGRDKEGEIYFDYLFGRPLKVNLTGDSFDPWGYDRDNGGDGTAARIVAGLR